jgi:hydrogenase 3 maturation protease
MEANWQKAIRSLLDGSKRPAVLGVGSILRGDDGAGVICAKYLQRDKKRGILPESFTVFIGETAPENITGVIIRSKPDRLIIVDAVESDCETPDVMVFMHREECIEGFSASTHKMPLEVLCTYLYKSAGCEIAVVGIHASHIGFQSKMSLRTRNTIRLVAREIGDCLSL